MDFKSGDRVRVKHDDSGKTWIVFSVFLELNEVLILGFEKNETCHRLVNPSEIILVDQNADLKQAIREVLLSEEFLTAFAKAFVNAPMPSTIQPAVLSTQVDRSLVDITQDAVKAKQVDSEQPQLLNGWRWLEVGEVIRKGDSYWYGARWYDFDCSIGEQLVTDMWPSIRRNRFEVGEKVVRVYNGVVYKVIRILSMGYQLESEFCAEVILHGKDLAPYIEETT